MSGVLRDKISVLGEHSTLTAYEFDFYNDTEVYNGRMNDRQHSLGITKFEKQNQSSVESSLDKTRLISVHTFDIK